MKVGRISGSDMKISISKKLQKIAAIVLKADALYVQGKVLDASEELDKLEKLLENVIDAIANEPVSDKEWDLVMAEVKNSPKFGNLPRKN